MKRILFFIYGIISYLLGFATLLYLIAFLGDFLVPKTIDGLSDQPLLKSILINIGLIILFGVQHSVMARPTFKKVWIKIVPEPLERSTYVLLTFVVLGLLMFYWQPLGGEVWSVNADSSLYIVLYAGFFVGWFILFSATFLINHFDLFGVRQVYLYLLNKPYVELVFKEHFFYKSIRHPIYLGVLMGMWFTPHMTISHLFLSTLWTIYVFYAISLEERNLTESWGEKYLEYKKRTGSVLPKLW